MRSSIKSTRIYYWALPAAIVLLALGLRLWGIYWNLPYVDHPDEGVIVDHATAFLRTRDLNPHFFPWPSLYMYVMAAVFAIQHFIGHLQGISSSIQSLPVSTFVYTANSDLYIWGRSTTALFGAATVAVVYLTGARNFSRSAGLIAAGLVAVSPLSIENAHYITPDVPLTLLTVVSIFFALEALRAQTAWPLVWAALFAGMAMSAKYNGGLAAVALLAVWLLRAYPGFLAGEGISPDHAKFQPRRLLALPAFLAPVAFVVGFVAFTPFSVLDWPKFLADLQYQTGAYTATKNLTFPGLPVWLNYVIMLFWSREWAIMISGIAGGIFFFWKRSRPALVLIVFAVTYLVFFNQYRSFFLRNVIALLPSLALLGGWFLSWLIETSRAYLAKAAPAFAAAAIAVAVVPGLYTGISLDRYMSQPDSRALATQWINATVLERGRIAVELNQLQWMGNPRVMAEGRPLLARKVRWYKAQGFSYLVFDSNAHPKDKQFVKSIPPELKLVKMFGGDQHGGLGPDVYAYATGVTPSDIRMQIQVNADFAGQLRLLGFDIGKVESLDALVNGAATLPNPLSVKPGQTIGLSLFWQAESRPAGDWTVFVHLVGPDGALAAQRDTFPQDGSSLVLTSRLDKGTIFFGPFNIPTPADLKPGTYKLELGLYSAKSGARLPVNIDGKQSDSLVLGEIEVK